MPRMSMLPAAHSARLCATLARILCEAPGCLQALTNVPCQNGGHFSTAAPVTGIIKTPPVDAVIASQRLKAIHLELRQELERVAPNGLGRVPWKTLTIIEQFLNVVKNEVPVEQRKELDVFLMREKELHQAGHPGYHEKMLKIDADPGALNIPDIKQRLLSLTVEIRRVAKRMRRVPHQILDQNSLGMIRQVLLAAEEGAKDAQDEPVVSVEKEAQPPPPPQLSMFNIRLNSRILQLSRNTKQMLDKLGPESRGTLRVKHCLGQLLAEYEYLIHVHRDRLDHVNIASMTLKIAQTSSYAGLGFSVAKDYSSLVYKLIEMLSKCLEKLEPVASGDLLWALGVLGYKIRKLSTARVDVDAVIGSLVENFEPALDLVNAVKVEGTMRGLAMLSFTDAKSLIGQVGNRIRNNPEDFTVHQLCSIMWSLTKLQFHCTAQLGAVLRSGIIDIERLSVKHLSNLIWIMGRIHYPQWKRLVPKMVQQIQTKAVNLTALQASKLTGGLSALGYNPGEETLDWVGKLMGDNMEGRLPEVVCGTLMSFTNLGYIPEAYRVAARDHFLKGGRSYDIGLVCDYLWSILIMGLHDEDTLKVCKSRIAEMAKDAEEWQFMHMAKVAIHLRLLPPKTGSSIILPHDVEKKAMDLWLESQQSKPIFAEIDEVLPLLQDMGYETDRQTMIQEIPLKVSCAIKPPSISGNDATETGGKYVVEVINGATMKGVNFIKGRAMWRQQVLGSQGYGLIKVFEPIWGKLSNRDEKKEYLKKNTFPAGTSGHVSEDHNEVWNDVDEHGDGVGGEGAEGKAHSEDYYRVDEWADVEEFASDDDGGVSGEDKAARMDLEEGWSESAKVARN